MTRSGVFRRYLSYSCWGLAVLFLRETRTARMVELPAALGA